MHSKNETIETMLSMLSYISRHGSVNTPDLVEVFGLSKSTINRYMATLRNQYHVDISYIRFNTDFSGAGEFVINDWGVFSSARVRKYF